MSQQPADPDESDSGWQYPPALDLPPCRPPAPIYPAVVAFLATAGAAAMVAWTVWPAD